MGRHELRKRYWSYAIPIIRKQHLHRGTFSSTNPTISNTLSGFFRLSGSCINCIANYNKAQVYFYLHKKEAFDMLFTHKEEIEQQVGESLHWERSNQYVSSWIGYSLQGVSITNEADWPRMAKFHAEWSDKLCSAILPYLQDTDDLTTRQMQIVDILREWTICKDGVIGNIFKSNRTYTRFTTSGMTEILPDIVDAPSGWGTDNHYFYEIVNRTGKSVYIQLSISSKNITPDFRQRCDQINEFYPAKFAFAKEDWQWRSPFKTNSISLEEEISKETIFAQLDERLNEILTFEADLKQKLRLN